MMCLGFEPGNGERLAQTKPRSYGDSFYCRYYCCCVLKITYKSVKIIIIKQQFSKRVIIRSKEQLKKSSITSAEAPARHLATLQGHCYTSTCYMYKT